RKQLVWSTDWAWPRHPGLVHTERIVFKHYPYRSPLQIQMRLDIRRDNRAKGFQGWDHAKELDWKAKIVNREECHYDDGYSSLKIDEAKLPQHLEKPWIRLIKRILHETKIWS
ncbi:hypothetical protein, partial [Moorena sp. SIO4A5]|uniref:hypothetical protein n=1 Tax=Moorena sp. SIO4A5 TaxID=2607838 RepID=UPI0013CD6C8C